MDLKENATNYINEIIDNVKDIDILLYESGGIYMSIFKNGEKVKQLFFENYTQVILYLRGMCVMYHLM